MEVLVASALLVIGLTLIAVQINRHIVVLEVLEGSVHSYRVADREFAQALLRRESGGPVAGQGTEEGLSWRVRSEAQPPPFQEFEKVMVEVPWSSRGVERGARLVAQCQKGKAEEK